MYTGSCLCKAVQFRINSELEPIQICHCSQCRKAQGSAFVTNIPVREEDIEFTSGEDCISFYESSPGKKRCFCKICGSPVYSKTVKVPGVVRIRAGLLNEPLKTKPLAHFYVADKANWYTITDELPQFDQQYVDTLEES
ncbi:MAG: GFA family protein [Ketobacteraceae bacterium]|nr:GFA family protein [Ketobacteraceae bacterium]